MQHFAQLSEDARNRLFAVAPGEFDGRAEPETLAVALGATLYLPGDRPRLAADLTRAAARGVVSAVVCLEDAVADDDVVTAQRHVVENLRALGGGAAPLTFVRVRHPEQITAIVAGLGPDAPVLTGFVLPKFTDLNGAEYLDALGTAEAAAGTRFFGMPVLETTDVIHRETRDDALCSIQRLLAKYPDEVLALRVGAADLSAAYGLRRGHGSTIYDVQVVAEAIAGIVNVFGRADGSGHVVTGPVWERYGPAADVDGLSREVVLDKANGLTGKTVIHPSQVPVVHALLVVTAEEYADATDVLATGARGGVRASAYGNKMNESKPHRAWAERTICRAAVFGVAADDVSPHDLLLAAAAG
jgi:citrate lyase beta subunit